MKENNFIILVTVYNSVKWIEQCLNSVVNQDYKKYKLIVIDDHSTDGTWEIINKYDTCSYRTKSNLGVGSLPNMQTGISMFSDDPEDIIITLDGDDWFSNNSVLSYLNDIYQDDNIWLTYGQYEPLSKTYSNYCKPIPNTRTYRRSRVWLTSHLRTFKARLWNSIDKNDFKLEDGTYVPACGDLVFMYPMIEMASSKHIKFIEKVLMVYNDKNPESEMHKFPEVQHKISKYLQSKPIYKEIE